jgi:2'-5' RNA ligase
VFDDLDVPVRWSKPNTYHITLYYLGENLFILKKLYLYFILRNIRIKKFNVRFNTVKLGISKRYKGLIYLDVSDGGDQLRELFLKVRSVIGGKDYSNFLTHLTIGRVNKDLSDEEYRNLVRDINTISKKLNISDISFDIDSMCLMESVNGENICLRKF